MVLLLVEAQMPRVLHDLTFAEVLDMNINNHAILVNAGRIQTYIPYANHNYVYVVHMNPLTSQQSHGQ